MQRAKDGLILLRELHQSHEAAATTERHCRLFGVKAFNSVLIQIVRNARSDTHFLPADCQPPEWSGMPMHSVALFRYPLSAPIELFDRTYNTTEAEWPALMGRLGRFFPAASVFAAKRPMKRLTLRSRFAADLITRYLALYSRIGSPDFSDHTIAGYVASIGGTV